MLHVTVKAELLNVKEFSFPEHSAELRAVRIIQGMNLKVIRDRNGVLASIIGTCVRIDDLPVTIVESKPIEILLYGVPIYRDPVLEETINKRLQEENFYKERKMCVIV